MDIAPKLFKGAKRKNCSVKKALGDQFWVNNLDIQHGFDLENIQQFFTLSEMVSTTQLSIGTPDSIR
jgi:hypothetical protein